MSRFLYAAANSASQEADTRFRLLIEAFLPSSNAYYCSGMQSIYALSNTYTPAGALGGMEAIAESIDQYPRGIRFWLKAVNSSDLVMPLSENLFGRVVKVRRCWLTSDNYTTVSAPELAWSGRINKVDVNLADPQKGNHFEIEVESRLRREPNSARFNRESLWNAAVQSSNGVWTTGAYSGDTFFNQIASIPGFQSGWGNYPQGSLVANVVTTLINKI